MLTFSTSLVYAGALDNGYSAPCSVNAGRKYCNAVGGYYFYDESTNKFWMPMNAVNSNGVIIDRKIVNYIPKTKAFNWQIPSTQMVYYSFIMNTSNAVAGQGGFISVNAPPKTPEQCKAELQKKRAASKQNAAKTSQQAKPKTETSAPIQNTQQTKSNEEVYTPQYTEPQKNQDVEDFMN